MKSIQKLLSVILSFSILLVSCSSENDHRSENNDLSEYSGKELFEALFFKHGKAVNSIRSINVKKSKNKDIADVSDEQVAREQSVDEFRGEIMEKIVELDPEYFENFKKQLSSKNNYSIQLALTNGSSMIKAAGYRSHYAGLFRLADDLKSKKIDLNSDDFSNMDLKDEEQMETFKNKLREEYAIDLEDDDYKVACTPGAVVCVVAVAVVATSVAAAAYYAVAVALVYSSVEFWGGGNFVNSVGHTDVLINELSSSF